MGSIRHIDAVVSLFSGAGGMSLGFAEAGLKPVLAADIDVDACATYADNLGDVVQCLDLANPSASFERELSKYTGAFALIGGPPCQGFSSAGLKSGTDGRNKLIFSYLNIVEKIRPRWFLFENVEGLLTSNLGHSVTELVRRFIKIGYRVRLEKVNFAAYGLPQARKRVLLIGNCIGVDFSLPDPTHSYNAGKHRTISSLPFAPSLDDALSGLGTVVEDMSQLAPYRGAPATPYDAMMRQGNAREGVNLHYTSKMSDHFLRITQHLKQGQTMKDIPESLWHESYRRRANRRVSDGTPTEQRGGSPSGIKRLVGNLNALTITGAATREFVHPQEDRPLTLREVARLQSFPDRYQFKGSIGSISQQIGNAFPPLAASVLAKHLMWLDNQRGSRDQSHSSDEIGSLIDFHLTDATGMSPALKKTYSLLETLASTTLPFESNPSLLKRAS